MALLARGVRGQTVRGLVIGLIYPQSPEHHLHQLTTVITPQFASLVQKQKDVFMVCVWVCVGGSMAPS